MANTKTSNLNALSSIDAGDLIPVVDTSASETKYITRANLAIDLAIPPADDTHDHGSAALNWRHYFMSGNFTVDSASWIGLGAAEGRIAFVDDTPDIIRFRDCIARFGANSGTYMINVTPSSAIAGLQIAMATINERALSVSNADASHTVALVKFIQNETNSATAYGLHVDSENAAGPAVMIEAANTSIEMAQGVQDMPFFNFTATADGDTTSAISTLTTSGATTHHVQVDINGVKAWIAVSTNVPS